MEESKLGECLQTEETPSTLQQTQVSESRDMLKVVGKHRLKRISLVLLTLQNTILVLSIRYSRTTTGDSYYTSTIVPFSELLKLIICFTILLLEQGSLRGLLVHLHEETIVKWQDAVKISVPAILYVIQTNLLYIALSNLEAAVFQVVYQLKILTTALFTLVLLKRKITRMQWMALAMLFVGVSLVQISMLHDGQSKKGEEPGQQGSYEWLHDSDKWTEKMLVEKEIKVEPYKAGLAIKALKESPENLDPERGPNPVPTSLQSPTLGIIAVLLSCCTSGFAGVYFEKLLKKSDISLWMRNTHLAGYSVLAGLFGVWWQDSGAVTEHGFTHGYTGWVWWIIVLQALGGLVIGVVVKYADNILKGFASALSILFSCIASVFLWDFEVTGEFALGTAIVLGAIVLYNKGR